MDLLERFFQGRLLVFIGLPKTGSTALHQYCLESEHLSTTTRKSTYFWIADETNTYLESKVPVTCSREYISLFQEKVDCRYYVEFCPDIVFFREEFLNRTKQLNYCPTTILITRSFDSFRKSFYTQLRRSEVSISSFKMNELTRAAYVELINQEVDYIDSYEEVFTSNKSDSVVLTLLDITDGFSLALVNNSNSLRNRIRGIIPKKIRKWLS